MKIIYIYCEGQTEESFINNVLAPYLRNIEIYVMPSTIPLKQHHQKGWNA